MPIITLPDQTQCSFNVPVTVLQVAEQINPNLAKAALAGRVDSQLVDLNFLLERDVQLKIITEKDPEGLEVIRHSAAHLLAQAVKRLFPEVQVTIGPVIENGFYYDFAYHRPFTVEDLAIIEIEMQALAKLNQPITRLTMSRDEAIQHFRALGEKYKVQIIEAIPEHEILSLYQQGDFIDLCRGPHVPNTNKLKAFKLMKVAGAYWRGDVKNPMLQRIYGTAWADRKELHAYLHRIADAEKRDHRKLAKQLDLFHLQEEGPGMVFWHPNGWTIYQTVQQYIRHKLLEHGYQEVNTPQVIDKSLWERSGHWEKFRDAMFVTASEERTFVIKPMNCPCHVQIFNQGLRSHHELPLRIAEFGTCCRNEPSGALHGLLRVRSFVQDDGHIFCREDQIQAEVSQLITMLFEVYQDFGFDDIIFKLATRPEQRIGTDELWDKAEQALTAALDAQNLTWEKLPGEGAFYGPKIEFHLRDCQERVWQCGTVQVDFFMPGRLGAHYIAENGSKQIPVMLHRAILGTLERFIGILLEHYAGILPTWLAPTQVVVMNITDNQAEYAAKISKSLIKQGFRIKLDLRNEKIGFKIREHTLKKIPYLLVVGDKEMESETVSVRRLDGKDLGNMGLEVFQALLTKQVVERGQIHKVEE